jgi:tripartite-type tricarboxylate transporter receptor subunit TctC
MSRTFSAPIAITPPLRPATRRQFVALGGMALAAPLSVLAQAADRPVRMVVANPPGGPLDIVARVIAEQLAAKWKQPVVVDNRAAGNGIVAADIVAKSRPDGTTILMTATFTESILPYAAEKLPYNAEKDLIPVTEIARVGFILLVPGDSPIKTFQDFVAMTRSSTTPVSVGGLGRGSSMHLAWELVNRVAGIRNVEYVAYRAPGQSQVDLLGGRLSMIIDTFGSSRAFVENGRLRAIAITSANRSAQQPAVPALAESGLKDFQIFPWIGLVAPSGTPPERLLAIQQAVAEAIAQPAVKARLEQFGFTPVGNGPSDMAATIRLERARFAPLVKELGITLE